MAFTEKAKVLNDAQFALNKQEQPWYVTVEGNSIIARWKWNDQNFFNLNEVGNEVKEYFFTVTLDDKGKWRELDKTEESSKGIKMEGGQISLGASKSSFMGKTNQKSFSMEFGKNKDTGKFEVSKSKFDTTMVKQPVRDFLTSNGWKKAGLFG